MIATISPLAEAALKVAMLGGPVLPLHHPQDGKCSCRAEGCGQVGKHPMGSLVPHGFKDATTDLEQVKAWWEQAPNANIGLRTGEQSGVFVLDVDGEVGMASLRELVAKYGGLPPTFYVQTPGGLHLYFRWQRNLGISQAKLGPGIDTQGEGGYVVIPPSVRPEGAYRYGKTTDYARAPAWLHGLLVPKPYVPPILPTPTESPREVIAPVDCPSSPSGTDPRRKKAVNRQIAKAAELEEGNRASGTFAIACKIRGACDTEEMWEESKAKLMEVMPIGYGSEGRPPFTEAEAERAIRNAEKYAELGRWTPTKDGNPFESPRVQLELLTSWAMQQPWRGRGGAYGLLGHLAFIRVARRANKLRVHLSVRDFALEIGTPSLVTARRVIRRVVDAGKVRRVDQPRAWHEAEVYDLVPLAELDPVHYEHTLLNYSREAINRVCLSCTALEVPDAFIGRNGLTKTAFLILRLIEEPKTTKALEDRTGKVRSTITRNLRDLEKEGLAEETAEGWVSTKESLEVVAERRGTAGAIERQRRYNEVQRKQRQSYMEDTYGQGGGSSDVQAPSGTPTPPLREPV